MLDEAMKRAEGEIGASESIHRNVKICGVRQVARDKYDHRAWIVWHDRNPRT